MGHKIGLKGCYFRPTKTDLLEGNDKMSGYVGVMHALTIGDEERLKLQVEKLSLQNNQSQKVIDMRLQEKDEKIESISEKCKVLTQAVTDMQELMKYPDKLRYLDKGA